MLIGRGVLFGEQIMTAFNVRYFKAIANDIDGIVSLDSHRSGSGNLSYS